MYVYRSVSCAMDIEKTNEKYAAFFSVEKPPITQTGTYEQAHTEPEGKPARARCGQSFSNIEPNIDIELIEPDQEPSVWREGPDKNGEGIHHIAFSVKDMDGCISSVRV